MELRISSTTFGDEIHEKLFAKGGVYRIFVKSENQPIEIKRFLGIDESGTLYIGKADFFTDRTIELKKSTDPNYKSSGHEFGVRYKTHPTIKDKFPYELLYCEFFISKNPQLLELEKLNEYFIKFGELPPFNRTE